MKRIRVSVETNKVGSRCETVIEVEDTATEKQIEEDARDAMFNMIEWNFRELEEGEEE